LKIDGVKIAEAKARQTSRFSESGFFTLFRNNVRQSEAEPMTAENNRIKAENLTTLPRKGTYNEGKK
jgi:hypothetical protein